MKISKSKQELAQIIRENGGWRKGNYAVQDKDDKCVWFMYELEGRPQGNAFWPGCKSDRIRHSALIPNWHQTTLSRDEYFHLYPAPDADGWIEWSGGECPVKVGTIVDVKQRDGDFGTHLHAGKKTFEPQSEGRGTAENWSHLDSGGDIIAYRLHTEQDKPEFCESVMRSIPEPEAKPTIEQLAADYRNAKDYAERKQQEADSAKADAEAKLAELVAAGKAHGLELSVTDTGRELVITDWRDLRVGDVIRCVGDWQDEETHGMIFSVDEIESPEYKYELAIRVVLEDGSGTWGKDFEFIRRP